MGFSAEDASTSRRQFLQRLGVVGLVGVGAPSVLAACDTAGSNQGKDVAQTFEVTVEKIGSSYPYSDQNNVGVAYAIGGEPGKVLTLERGKRYEFALRASVESGPNGLAHPFYIGRTAEGQGGDEFSQGVENANSTSGSVFFTPPSEAPSTLYYQCSAHVYMGGKIDVVDEGGSSGGGY